MRDKRVKYWILILIALVLILLFAAFFALCTGSANILAKDIWQVLFYGKGTTDYNIIVNLRLPRIILAISVGGALSLAGTILQGMFKNPLVEPYTLGISGGASLGVCITIIFQLHGKIGIIAYPLSGFTGAVFVIFLVYSISSRAGTLKSNRMLLTGVMISYVASSLVMLLMAISKSDDLNSIVFWIMGNLDEPDLFLIKIAVSGSFLCLAVSYLFCHDLNALVLGEDAAAHLGVNTARTKKSLFIIASILTGLSVSVCGIIMFVGLIIPHFMRMTVGPDHRILLISSFLGGAAFLILCDVAARTVISPMELPVGVITGIIGGVVFIYVLGKKKVTL